MIHTHDGYYTLAPPLTFDEAIYWTDDAAYSEWMISTHVLEYAKFDVRADATERLCFAVIQEIAKNRPTWLRYTTVPSEHTERVSADHDQALVMRHTCYEQPGFREVKLYRGTMTTLRIMHEGGAIADLPLRKLMYNKEPARGALYDGVLYVMLP